MIKPLLSLSLFLLISCGAENQDEKISQTSEQDTTAGQEIAENDFDTSIQVGKLPEPWYKAGSKPHCYEMDIDTSVKKSGNSSAFIRSVADSIGGFGTMMQTCSPDKYFDKRIKLSGYVKSENVADWAGMWLRIDGYGGAVCFDNMEDRSITGTTDWTLCEIVMDVPKGCYSLNFGVLLSGTGKVWFDDFSFEIVSKELALTYKPFDAKKLPDPDNLGFEDE